VTESKPSNMINLTLSPNMEGQGTFNENLRRSFGKNLLPSRPCSADSKRRNMRRKISQVRLSGRIPLVNTSSEEEVEPGPPDRQPQPFVRGGSTRNSVRKNSDNFTHLSPLPSVLINNSSKTSQATPASPVMSSSFSLGMSSFGEREAKLTSDIEQLHQVTGGQQRFCDSGMSSFRVEMEEEMSSSIQITRKNMEERLALEMLRHKDKLGAATKDRDLERKNFQLKCQQFREERDGLGKEIEDLNEQVRQANIEKENRRRLVEQQAQKVAITTKDTKNEAEEKKFKNKEKEVMTILQCLTVRLQSQDQDLADVKEDNIELRWQIRSLKEAKEKEAKAGGIFKIFGGNRETIPWQIHCEDPQKIRLKLRQVEQELTNQKEVNSQLRQYVGEVLVNIMATNPQIFENS